MDLTTVGLDIMDDTNVCFLAYPSNSVTTSLFHGTDQRNIIAQGGEGRNLASPVESDKLSAEPMEQASRES
ncbi:hypothetical protein Scep_026398 [Stephania cephalantha]|uniref:Uncharacterized protein n=1 Tax=Stephania cephalantha TaxID=152367 RepID=A0AAP0ETY1_9MAGN